MDNKQAAFVRREVSCIVGMVVTGVSRVATVRVKSRRLFLRGNREVTAVTACPIRVWVPMALTTTMIVERSVWMGGRIDKKDHSYLANDRGYTMSFGHVRGEAQ